MADRSPGRAGPAGGARPEDDAGTDRCTVIHLDMDAFFAAIEVLDDPSLAGRPVVVGGDGPRGVVASCTYEARAHGVRSAMPSMEARRRCPAAVFRPARHDRYAEVSRQLHAVLRATTPVVEPIGLDEAFLDVAGQRRRLGPPEAIAGRLRDEVTATLGLTCAAGVARTKSLAKLASRRAKAVPPHRRGPTDGLVVVTPAAEASFLDPLPVRELWGVGPATAARLAGVGIRTVADLAAVPTVALARLVGRAAADHLVALATRTDHDPVVADRPVKSIGRETTLAADRHTHQGLAGILADLAGSVGDRLAAAGMAGRTVTVKVRFADRRTITRAATVAGLVDGPQQVLAVARGLLDQVDVAAGVRLLGVAASGLEPIGGRAVQLSLDPGAVDDPPQPPPQPPLPPPLPGAERAHPASRERPDPTRWRQVDGAVSAVRRRFGSDSLVPLVAVPEPPVAPAAVVSPPTLRED